MFNYPGTENQIRGNQGFETCDRYPESHLRLKLTLFKHPSKVVELSRRKGEIKARDVQRSFDKANCPNPATVRQWFAQLTEQGWGTLNGSGTGLTFTASQKQTVSVIDTQVRVESSTPDTETLLTQPDEPGCFSKGDRVVVTDPKSEWHGMHGVIDRTEGTNGSSQYYVEGENSSGRSVATWLKKSQISSFATA